MRHSRSILASGLLALASRASAQTANACVTTDVCFKLNIPQSTADSGNGDIFFQLSAPSDYEWVALGQGTGMADAQIFVVYTSGSNNVTISPRLGTGHVQPSFNSGAQVTLLEGSGISNGKMVANVRCSSCNSWSGGSADFTQSSGNWIWAAHTSNGPKNSNSQSASISQHDEQDTFQWQYANAKGGNSVNPLIAVAASGTASGGASVTSCVPRPSGAAAASTGAGATATSTKSDDDNDDHHRSRWGTAYPTASPTGRPWDHDKRQSVNYCDDSSNSFTSIGAGSSGQFSNQKKMLIAHGVLAALAFVIFFPMGSIAIRLASFPGVVWFHAAFQAFAYLVYIAAFGLGVYLANEFDMLDKYHPIIGIVVFVCLFFQPIFGFLHHSLFKKYQSRTFWSYGHIWLGRIIITLGIINGGLGMMLADTMQLASKKGMIAYGVIAGIVWLVWVAAIIIGERRRGRAAVAQPPKYSESPRAETSQRSDIPHPENGHYAPKP